MIMESGAIMCPLHHQMMNINAAFTVAGTDALAWISKQGE